MTTSEAPLGNWGGNLLYTAAAHAAPTTVEELQEVVARTHPIRALGTRHSFSTVADTPGTLVSTLALELPIEVDEQSRVAVVPGGATYAVVADELHRRGWALHNMGSLPHISVAGAGATGTHGSGNHLGNLATSVVAVELVRADGELVRFEHGDPEFPGSVLALGCLGVVTRLWLRLEPTYDVSQVVFVDNPAGRVVDRIDEVFAAAYSVSVFSSFRDRQSVDTIWFKTRLDTPAHADPADLVGGTAARADVHPVPGHDPAAATPQRGTPGPWHERLPHFRSGFTPSAGQEIQSELLLPRAAAAKVLDALSAIAAGVAPALQVFEMRTIAADDLWLSPAYERDNAALHFTWFPDTEAVLPVLTMIEERLAPFDARTHWGKVFTADPAAVRGQYDHLDDFLALAKTMDPTGKFRNDLLDRYL
jgi:xylitol oxidase